MDIVRRENNLKKRAIIDDACRGRPGALVLDVGCGFGGDLQKWSSHDARVDMCEPDISALKEAQRRAKSLNIHVKFIHGDIRDCPNKLYDIICYNFSIHYIFESRDTFIRSIKSIRQHLKKGGILVGCIPDCEQILMNTPFSDDLGNIMIRKDGTGMGEFGEKLFVQLADTPFYANGPRPEPLAYKDMLVTHLENKGILLERWEQFQGLPIQQLYSSFRFVCRG